MRRSATIAAFTALCVSAAIFAPPMPQSLGYHLFADRRTFFGVPNFLDVASNIGFFAAGVFGLYATACRKTSFGSRIERLPYALFFLAVLLTTFGSGYYHLQPDNERLFWDRLPMTVAFMSLIAAQITERIGRKPGLYLLVPMLLAGLASVFYWRFTERAGIGNVIPYGILQGYSMVALVAIAVPYRSRYTHADLIYAVFAAYVLSKLLETFDRDIFSLDHYIVSGHSLKHLIAALAAGLVAEMLRRRRCVIEFGV